MTKKWRHVGGGCFVNEADAPDPLYPCDDQYEDDDGNWAYFETTRKAHFSMPGRVSGETVTLDEVKAHPGVRFLRIQALREARPSN